MGNIFAILIAMLFLEYAISSTTAKVYTEDLDQNHYAVYKDLKVKWIDAFINCQANGAQLLHMDTLSELQFVAGVLRNSGISNVQRETFWTSGSDIHDENRFIWMSNGKSIANTMWAPGNPSNSWGGEHCVTMHGDHGFLLNDDNCTKSFYYVCKSTNYPNLEPKTDNMENQVNLQPQSLKADIAEDQKYHYDGSVLAVLIIIALCMVVITVIGIKEEMHKIMQRREAYANV